MTRHIHVWLHSKHCLITLFNINSEGEKTYVVACAKDVSISSSVMVSFMQNVPDGENVRTETEGGFTSDGRMKIASPF